MHDSKSLFLSPIHTGGSDYFSSAGDTAAATVNHEIISPVRPIISPPKRLIPRTTPTSPWNSMFGSNNSSDPRIGYNIFANSNANDVSGTELDTLAYSASLRDHDESTLFSSDAFLRKYGVGIILIKKDGQYVYPPRAYYFVLDWQWEYSWHV
jgi:hypothetical protein